MEKRVQDYSKEILKIIRSNTSPAVMGGCRIIMRMIWQM